MASVRTQLRVSGIPIPLTITKDPSNPTFDLSPDAWDINVLWPGVVRMSATDYRMWYSSLDVSGNSTGLAYATSTDGLTWTKPNLGIVTYAGNANNNLVLGTDYFGVNVVRDEAGGRFLAIADSVPSSATNVLIFSSNDGIHSWTLIKTLSVFPSPKEGFGLIVRPNEGRWLAYYLKAGTSSPPLGPRVQGVFLSDTTDPAGAWTDQGDVIGTGAIDGPVSITVQRYVVAPANGGGSFIGAVSNYNGSTGKTDQIQLWTSADGVNGWTQLSTTWIVSGAGGSDWDFGQVYPGTLLWTGTKWRLYYAGANQLHGVTPFQFQIGYAETP